MGISPQSTVTKGKNNATVNYDNIPTIKYTKSVVLELPITGIYLSNYTIKSKNNDGSAVVSFTAHNRMNSWGKVSVYNASGTEVDCSIIKPYSGNITGVFDYANEVSEWFKDLGSLISWDMIAMNAKETKIEVSIPKGGFLTITNSSSIEGLSFTLNILSIALSATSLVSAFNTDFSTLTASDFKNLTSEKFAQIFFQEFSKSIIYSIKPANKMTKDDIDLILKFAIKFCSSDEGLNLLNYLLKNETKNALSSAANVCLSKLSMGASDFVFGIEKVKELGDQIKCMAASWDDGYVKITNNTATNAASNAGHVASKASSVSVVKKEEINADRWTNKNTTVYDTWEPNTRKVFARTIPAGTRVKVYDKLTLSNGEVVAYVAGYNGEQGGVVLANNLNVAAPPVIIAKKETINADRWTNKTTTVYDTWNPNTRKKYSRTIPAGTKVKVYDKLTLSNGEVVAYVAGYNGEQGGVVKANDLNNVAP